MKDAQGYIVEKGNYQTDEKGRKIFSVKHKSELRIIGYQD